MFVKARAEVLLWWVERWGLIRRPAPVRRVAAAGRAVALWRRAPASAPAAGGLARALTVLGGCLLAAGRVVEARAAAGEALTIYGVAGGVGCAEAHHVLAQALDRSGRLDDTRAAAETALAGYRATREPRSVQLTARLAAALFTYGQIVAKIGCHDEALSVTEESVRLIDTVPLLRRGRMRTHWQAQCHLVILLWGAGRHAEALPVGDDVLGFLDLSMHVYPSHLRPLRAELLVYLALCHGRAGHDDRAVLLADRAVGDYRRLGEPYRASTGWALEVHADRLTAVGRHGAGDTARREAAQIYTALAAIEPDRYRESVWRVHGARADALWKAGDREASVAVVMEFLPVLSGFAAADAGTYRPCWPIASRY